MFLQNILRRQKWKEKDERCFTWVIDILLRIPAPSSSFWILHFTLGHYICTQIFNVSLSGTAQRTLSFQETCHLCEKRETTLPYSSPWVVHHPFAHAEIVECKTAINVLTSFKLLSVMGFCAIMFSSHFLHLRCASISRTYAVQLAHPPACGACLTIIILSKYHLFTQMMALAMSVIFQDGGSRSSKQTTYWNKKKFDADILFWLWHSASMYDYHPEFTLFSSHNQRTPAQSPNLTI